MNCREFRQNHAALLDSTLTAQELVGAQRHMLECIECASHDASVRRALLVFRNLPAIELSRNFSKKLNSRLAHARALGPARTLQLLPTMSAVAVAAGLLFMVGIAATMHESQGDLTFPPTVASRPAGAASQLVAPAIAASMSAGIPAWPAVFMVERASQQLADAELHFTSHTPR